MSSIIQDKRTHINNYLKKIRKEYGAQAVVGTIQKMYPKFDKTLESKVENGHQYGIQLMPDAKVLVMATYGPLKLDERKLSHRVQGRISESLAKRLTFYLTKDNDTIQNLIDRTVTEYVKRKEHTYDISESIYQQKDYCNKNGLIRFAPWDGTCPHCGGNIYSSSGNSSGYSVYTSAHSHITACPHCRHSFLD